MSETTDAYRDLGYIPRNEIEDDIGTVQKILGKWGEKMNPETTRARNFEIIKQLDPNLIDSGQGTVTLSILGRQIDFHLPSNTYYSHAKQKFGYGIDEQVKIIMQFLEKKS